MKKSSFLFFNFIIAIFFVSCNDTIIGNGDVVTRRIQYDVSIKSPDPTFDWWIQNIEGESREIFVKGILQAAYDGKVQAYDVFHNKMSQQEVKAIGNREDTITFQRTEPPYELYDTVIRQTLSLNDITRLRFLEEWTINPEDLKMEKRIIGICPMLESYAPDGSLRGYMPMFWVYYDDEYPGVLATGGLTQ